MCTRVAKGANAWKKLKLNNPEVAACIDERLVRVPFLGMPTFSPSVKSCANSCKTPRNRQPSRVKCSDCSPQDAAAGGETGGARRSDRRTNRRSVRYRARPCFRVARDRARARTRRAARTRQAWSEGGHLPTGSRPRVCQRAAGPALVTASARSRAALCERVELA